MPTTTLAPTAILEQTNLSGAVTLVDEDPDSPSNDWMSCTSNSVDVVLRVSFATPPAPPTGTQTFKAYVRKSQFLAPSSPTVRLDLYENGSLVDSGSNQTIGSSIGALISESFDLDATPLSDPTGAGVELRLFGNAATVGSPDASIDIDALNWDTCNYTVTTVERSASLSTVSSISSSGGTGQFNRSAALATTSDIESYGYGPSRLPSVRPPFEVHLAAEITSSLVTIRFSPEERDVGQVLMGTSFGTEMPGGFGAADLEVSRPEFFDPDDLLFGACRIFQYEDDRTLYEGRVMGVNDNGVTITFELEGWSKHLSDNGTAQVIFVDRDFASWEGPSVQYQLTELLAGVNAQGASVVGDPTTGSAALDTLFEMSWTADFLPCSVGFYNGQGLAIDYLDYCWKSSVDLTGQANYFWAAYTSNDELLGAGTYDTTGDLEAVGPGSGTLSATTSARKWAAVQFLWTSGAPPIEYSGYDVHIYWTLLGVFGDTGLTPHGTLSTPNTGRGFYASEMIQWTVEQFAPLLSIGDIETTNLFTVPHASYRDPTTAQEIVDSLVLYGANSTYPLDWWVDEEQRFNLASPENHGRTWRCRYSEGTEANSAGADVSRLLNGVVVTYDDGSGTTHSVGPTGSNAEYTTSALLDTSDSNPVNRDGAQHWEVYAGPITSQAGAVLIGGLILAERNRQVWRGDVTIKGRVRDENGIAESAAFVRAGDYLIISDDEDTRPRRIISTDYDPDGRIISCSIGAPPDRLEGLLAKLNIVLVGKL